jgi:hypothetical protein
MTPETISNVLLFLFIITSINKTNANIIHSLSNKNKPKSVRMEKGTIGSTKTKDIIKNIAIGITLVLRE